MIELKSNTKFFKFLITPLSSIAVFLVILFLVFLVWITMKNNEILSLESNCEITARLNSGYLEDSNDLIKDSIKNLAQKGVPLTNQQIADWNNIAEVYVNTNDAIGYIALYDRNFDLIRLYPQSSYSLVPEYFPEKKTESEGFMDVLYPIYSNTTLLGFIFSEININEIGEKISSNDDNFNIIISNDSNVSYNSAGFNPPKNYPRAEAPVKMDTIGNYKITVWPTTKYFSTSMAKPNQFMLFGIMSAVLVQLLLMLLQHRAKESILTREQNKMFVKQIENEQRLESIGILSSSVAHEINNPINGIMNYTQLIKDVLQKDSDESLYADEIIIETERIAGLVKNILNFSRKSIEHYSLVNVQDIIARTRNLADTLLLKDGIDLEVKCPGDIPAIRCSTNKIQQVLLNLLINSRDSLNEKFRKYDENKKIILTASADYRSGIKGVIISVKDFGMGIDEKTGNKIFQSFYTTKPEGIGTGLGLFISKKIIEDHKGEIWFESQIGKETSFHIFLPYQNE